MQPRMGPSADWCHDAIRARRADQSRPSRQATMIATSATRIVDRRADAPAGALPMDARRAAYGFRRRREDARGSLTVAQSAAASPGKVELEFFISASPSKKILSMCHTPASQACRRQKRLSHDKMPRPSVSYATPGRASPAEGSARHSASGICHTEPGLSAQHPAFDTPWRRDDASYRFWLPAKNTTIISPALRHTAISWQQRKERLTSTSQAFYMPLPPTYQGLSLLQCSFLKPHQHSNSNYLCLVLISLSPSHLMTLNAYYFLVRYMP